MSYEDVRPDYEDLMTAIIKMQMRVIGEGIAIHLAKSVEGLEITHDGVVVSYIGDPVKILEELVKIYKKVEKNVAITLAIHAIRPLLEKNPELRIPEILSVYKTPLYGK
ncbi:MAG: hypothetical protein DRO90_00665 [Candidatus Altiarchaeales archaeon]|nr:MAG: hypothetical protein DRO90_00665 [Candidatus Altiarchaeales archaeon]